MADPNPARGMPIQFKKYYLAGAGAGIIRWGTAGDLRSLHQADKREGHRERPQASTRQGGQRAVREASPRGHRCLARPRPRRAEARRQEALIGWGGPPHPRSRQRLSGIGERVCHPGVGGSRCLSRRPRSAAGAALRSAAATETRRAPCRSRLIAGLSAVRSTSMPARRTRARSKSTTLSRRTRRGSWDGHRSKLTRWTTARAFADSAIARSPMVVGSWCRSARRT